MTVTGFSAPSRVEDTGVHDGYATIPLVKGGRWRPAATRFAEWLDPTVVWAVVSRLEPGGYLLPHRDKGPWWPRVHVPIEPAGWYWDTEVGAIQFDQPGTEYVVRHHLPHAVWNDTNRVRIHLVIDRGTQHGTGTYETYPDACTELTDWLNTREQ